MPRFSFLAVPVSDEVKALVGTKDTHVSWWRLDDGWRRTDQLVGTDGAATIALVVGPTDTLPDLAGSRVIIQVKDPGPLPPPQIQAVPGRSVTDFIANMDASLPYVAILPTRDPTRPT